MFFFLLLEKKRAGSRYGNRPFLFGAVLKPRYRPNIPTDIAAQISIWLLTNQQYHNKEQKASKIELILKYLLIA